MPSDHKVTPEAILKYLLPHLLFSIPKKKCLRGGGVNFDIYGKQFGN